MKTVLEAAFETIQTRKESLFPLFKIFSRGPISNEEAIAAIRRYQEENPNSAKSIWMDDSIVKAIAGGSVPGVSGIRLYYVRYAMGPAIDNYSVLVSLTEDVGGGIHKDKSNSYFDYGQPCPPGKGCNGGLSF